MQNSQINGNEWRSLPYLQEKRVFLRLAKEDDIAQIISFYFNNAAHFEKVSSPKPLEFYTAEFWQNKVITSLQDFHGDRACNLFIFDLDIREIIGFINFFSFIRGAFHACILGYGLSETAQGKGLMTEALQLAIDFVFRELNIHRIMANYSPTNERSGKLLQRLNFTIEGYARNYLLIHGEWQDHILTSLTNHAWKLPEF
jgi:[ribosomal protein S5]-alanine N-acetyltransferase